MKPSCYWGHEMVLKDDKKCYKCKRCFKKKEDEHWWCQSCWDRDKSKFDFCFECVSEKGSHQHIIINESVK